MNRLLVAILALLLPAAAAAETFAITNARIFDGERLIPRGTVVVKDGKIEFVGAEVKVPEGAERIDAAGGTLLPGFIDAHTHAFPGVLERALAFGVTTELDMFTTPAFASQLKEEQNRPGGAPGRADLFSAGNLATAPGGHGTQFGLPVPTLTKPEEARAWVDARVAEGSDYIKIAIEDFSAYGGSMPSLDKATVAALIEAAHARGKLAVVHVSTAASARQVVEAGADAIIHLFSDREADPDFARLAAERKVFVIPTLTVLESTNGIPSGKSLTEDTRVRGFLKADEIENLGKSYPAKTAGGMPAAYKTVSQLVAAGVPILAGSDAPNPGTTHGASLHRELELLVQAGLSPQQALIAATSAPARAFKLADRGRIAPGMRADMILVAGDPLKDITETRNLVRIWKGGVPFERPVPPQAPAQAAAPMAPVPALPADGLVSSFEDGKLSASFGSGWTESKDKLFGGVSEVKAEVVSGGAQGSRHALKISGEVKPGFAFPFAGVMFMPGAQPMAPVNLADVQALEFWMQGDGAVTVMLFAASLGQQPSMKTVEAGPEWKKHTLPISDFPGIDQSGLMGIFFGVSPAPRTFEIRVDDVRLIRRTGE
ncbi:MAG TPA: amidohydrolase family protein [Thermoanaerobaculia bacterium]|nr:amidohydrolase family protein [Thermoanaerobaculia bacterium]